jgi:hypothetical protein
MPRPPEKTERGGGFTSTMPVKAIPVACLICQPAFLLEEVMTRTQRILLCAIILAVDLVVFFLPLTAIFLIYIIMQNPPWFREFLQQLDRTHPSS